ncbi:multisubunit sodium/proton antiporter, MrpD subunit [Halothece sp. PCC 7418]|uniref:Multiple resistance and pH regulation n=1 Tax=Aphanothece halophytica TaxID=72020 RepID=C7G3J0_APHHA|nr:cation:proton antiporter [Halothece sp. PCC 7418]AFZ43185.1 multisubunit sodium/proton antiporter, MrpD subunit [Halothece sp. PCC 7418]BAI23230.1 multiple resistance and pH regulation [Aphanothece halophytica]
MMQLTIVWIALSFFVGFVIYLVPNLSRWLALVVAFTSLAYSGFLFLQPSAINIQLLDSFGVTLIADQLSSFFILTNALVTIALIFYCWQSEKPSFFFMQLVILHGSVNATFICADLISLYVALEVISIAAFLLISYPRSDRVVWVGLRYLFVSNTAMLFYLVGTILVYQVNHSFSFAGLQNSPPDAIALIFLGLLVKGGIFFSGLWLPLTHSESESPVSAMLSGVVVKAGVFPLVRLALMIDTVDPIVRFFGVGTALLGVAYAIFEKDTKRTLAFSTISQLGFIVAAPAVGGFYALTHGLVKSALFLIAGNLPSRDFKQLQDHPIPTEIWITLVIAGFSISGFPLLSGFGAKVLTSKNLLPWQVVAMNLAAFGTAITLGKFIFLPHQRISQSNVKLGFWLAMFILLGGLVAANVFYYEAYTLENILKPLAIIALGWLTYLLLIKKVIIQLPRNLEKFDHLVGGMPLMLILLFWSVWTKSSILK